MDTSTPNRPLRVAIIGAGPAGIYAADSLIKSDTSVSVDLIERQPAPFGLVRYGVAPDHPRIKGIVNALHKVCGQPGVRLLGNVEFGRDVKLDELRQFYDAVIIATGAEADRDLNIPGIDLPGSHGAAEFVSWYDGHPDVSRDWPLEHVESAAVIGAGNVSLDVARILAKTVEELRATEIPENVERGLRAKAVREVHVFARRGPAQAKFTPLELRELDHSPNVEVIVDPENIEFDQASMELARSDKQVDMVVKTLQEWAIRDPGERPVKLHLHFLHAPARVLGSERVEGLRTERMELDGTGNVRGTGEYHDWPVQAVFRAVGYASSHLPGIPFDHNTLTIPHEQGRVLDIDGQAVAGLYVTGWIKRGPVGLIGHTKGDASETVRSLLADLDGQRPAEFGAPEAVEEFLVTRGIPHTTWDGWMNLDRHERALGERDGRERIKVVEREGMLSAARNETAPREEG